jgi:hypothetical protein
MAQTFWVAEMFGRMQAWPVAVLQVLSSVQANGHALAATHALPADP